MALFLFLLGILLIFGIGRYNESNKLFWVLLLSFIGSYTAASIALNYKHDTKKNKEIITQVSPTQGLYTAFCDLLSGNDAMYDNTSVTLVQKPVGQGLISELNNGFILSEALPKSLELFTLLKPPRFDTIYDTS